MGGVIALPKLFKQAQAAEAAKLSPTVAEVSQSEATSADGYDLRKTKIRPLYVPNPEDSTCLLRLYHRSLKSIPLSVRSFKFLHYIYQHLHTF